jgi:hypothetical protein
MPTRNIVIAPQNVGLAGGSGYTPTSYTSTYAPAPTTPYAPPAPTPTSTPSFQLPDFASLINSDPGLIQLRADLQAQGIASAAQRTAATRRGVTQFGLAPQDFSGNELSLISPTYGQDVDQATLDAARGNTFSTQSRLAQANKDAIQALRNSLASRGLLHSGELGYQMGNEERNFETGQYDARNKLLDYLASVQSAYAQGEQQRQAALAGGYQNAMATQLQLWLAGQNGNGGAPPPAAPPSADTTYNPPSNPPLPGQYAPPTLHDALLATIAGHRSGL